MSTALVRAIEGEEAAVYAYGVAAAFLTGASSDLARGGLAAHRFKVAALRQTLAAAQQPPAPLGFELTRPVDADTAARLLADVESRLCAVYADLAAETSQEIRRDAVLSARECAVRAIAWGATPQAFPGR
jgi:hypothetical protein